MRNRAWYRLAVLWLAFVVPFVAAEGARFEAEDLNRLVEIGGGEGGLYFSPDGRRVAFMRLRPREDNRSYEQTWQVLEFGTGAVTDAGDGGDIVLPQTSGQGLLITGDIGDIQAKWSPDGRWFAYLRRDGVQTQVWRSNATSGVQQRVTRHDNEVVAFEWSEDGARMYFQLGRSPREEQARDRAEADVGYLLDERFRPSWARQPLRGECPTGSQPRGPHTLTCDGSVWVTDLSSGEMQPGDRPGKNYFMRRLGAPRPDDLPADRAVQNTVLSEDRKHWAWLENLQPQRMPGYAAPLTVYADGKACTRPLCSGMITQTFWSKNELFFIRREGHHNVLETLYRWNPRSGTLAAILRDEMLLSHCQAVGGRAVCLYEAPKTPIEIVSIDLRSGKRAVLHDPNPGFSRFALGTVRRVDWFDAFGAPTHGHLVYPPDYVEGKRYPLVIVQYRSRGFLRGGVGNEYPIYPLAAAGMLVLSFDRPDQPQGENKCPAGAPPECFMKLDRELRDRSGPLSALESFIDEHVARGLVDPARVGICGLSDGANTVSYALPRSRKFAAAAQSQSTTSLQLALSSTDATIAWISQYLAPKDLIDAIERYQPESLSFHANTVHTPLLVQVSDAELLSTLPAVVALKYAGKPVETYVFPGEYHLKVRPQHKLTVYRRSIDWFRFWLQDYEDPAPAKTGQYERWRAMRAQTLE